MEAKELRIGNFVNFAEEGVLFQVVEIDSEGLTVENKEDKTWIELETFEGIKITEKWLEKLGFIDKELYALHNIFIWFDNHVGIKGMLGMIKPFECKYVHQLQNLYFALTGEELLIKQP